MSILEIPLNDFRRQWADTAQDVLAAVTRVGESGWYVLGSEVERFERALADVARCREVIGCASGLDAIELCLRALKIPPGTKVLTTPLSAFATTLAIVRAGCVPVFVDVDDRGLIDLDRARRVLASDPTVRIMVPVHLFGHVVDLAALEDLRDRFDLRIVEDCAQSIGASSLDRFAGSVGQLAATSFYPTKNLGALGDGGAVMTSDADLAARCRWLRDYGQSKKYVHDELGLNSRLDELHAAVLSRAFLPRLAGWTKRRRAVADAYREGIDHRQVRVLPVPSRSRSVWHLFPVLVPAAGRDVFMRHLQARGIRTAIHYPTLIPRQRALDGQPLEIHGDLALASEIASREVSLPIHPYLDEGEVNRVIAAVNEWPGV